MDTRRIKVISLALSRIRYLLFLLCKRKFRMAANYLWTSAFTRDAGLALLDPLYRLLPALAPYPQALEVEVTTRCHLRCTICEHTYWKEPPRDMTFEEFKRIVEQFPKLKWIGMTGIGSSFLNKDFLEMLRYLKSKSIFVEFYDSFDLIDEKAARQLIEMNIDKIWLSMEAATKETYEKIRAGTSFDKILNNVKNLIRLKMEMQNPFPELWFHYIINKDNEHEMPQFVELVHSLVQNDDMNYATLIFFTNLLHFKEVEHLRPTITKEIMDRTLEKGRELGIFINWNENVSRSEPITKCTKWLEPFVLVTGHVQPCCCINEANEREFQKKYAFGNLLETDFHNIWKSAEFAQFRRMLRTGKLPEVCKNCRVYYVPE